MRPYVCIRTQRVVVRAQGRLDVRGLTRLSVARSTIELGVRGSICMKYLYIYVPVRDVYTQGKRPQIVNVM